MQSVSPRQLARAIGASESSVKRWCDRGLVASLKTAGGHRRLLLCTILEFLEKHGYALIRPEEIGLPATVAGRFQCEEKLRAAFNLALEQGDQRVCRRLLAELRLAGCRIDWICDEILAVAMEAIGRLWHAGQLEIYQERRACEIVVSLLWELVHWTPPVPLDAPSAIGCGLEGDHYALPSHMVEVILRDAGWNAASLGCNVPIESLAAAMSAHRPRVIWICVSHVVDKESFLSKYEQLWRSAQQLGTAVAVGGYALSSDLRKSMSYSFYGDKFQHLVNFVTELQR
ncbi:MAG: B12-binding domain-containing protein [Planctomycetota bacterium]|nr:B12-binding domain-containing protein [Planctomycetota bacterium]MDA1177855.1 B12-binding domain-containing protein [Planctomycetota bacterium]